MNSFASSPGANLSGHQDIEQGASLLRVIVAYAEERSGLIRGWQACRTGRRTRSQAITGSAPQRLRDPIPRVG
jgi:hypothetical protein